MLVTVILLTLADLGEDNPKNLKARQNHPNFWSLPPFASIALLSLSWTSWHQVEANVLHFNEIMCNIEVTQKFGQFLAKDKGVERCWTGLDKIFVPGSVARRSSNLWWHAGHQCVFCRPKVAAGRIRAWKQVEFESISAYFCHVPFFG